MANTERFNTLQKVVLARKEVNTLRQAPDLTPDEDDLLATTYSQLTEIEDLLVLQDLQQSIGEIGQAAKKLSAVVGEFEAAAARLKKAATMIGDAAKALGALADILAKAAAGGIG